MDPVTLGMAKADAKKKYAVKSTPISRLVRNRVDAGVMSAPPIFSTSSTSTLAQNFPVGSASFRISGAPVVLSSGANVPKGTTKTDGTFDVFRGSWRISFDFDGPAFEFRTTPQTDSRMLVWVNEQPHAAAPIHLSSITGAVVGTPNWTKVTFGSRAPRRIMIELIGNNNVNFNSLNKAFSDSIQPPSIPSPRLVWVGDSISYGIGASDFRNAYPIKTAWLLGIDNVFNCTAQPSSGLVRPPSATFAPFGGRFAADVQPLNPDILVIQCSINDATNWPQYKTQIGPALAEYVATAKASFPNVRIVVIGPIFAGFPSTAHTGVRDEVKPVAASLGLPFIDTMDASNPVFTGNGQVGAPTGDGNADYYREADAIKTHPSDAGHDYLARWMAGQISRALEIPL